MTFKPITPRQKEFLKKRGYDTSNLSAYTAWLIVGKIKALGKSFGVEEACSKGHLPQDQVPESETSGSPTR